MTREERENYIVPDGSDYVRYDYVASTGDWTQAKVTRPDSLSTPRKTGLIYDWRDFMSGMTYQEKVSAGNENEYVIYSGDVSKSVLQEILGNNVFGSFIYSMEWLLDDKIPCTFYIDAETALPDHFVLDFSESFIPSDMTFTLAELTVNYGEWNNLKPITAPKRVTVVSTDTEAEFYANYYAWNLFLPYIGGQIDGSGTPGNGDQTFSASWDSFQVRIDGGMTKIPLTYADLEKVGYKVEEKNAGLIVEPNKYKEDVVLIKGSDKLTVWLYNDDTVAQPVTSCKICAKNGIYDAASALKAFNDLGDVPGKRLDICVFGRNMKPEQQINVLRQEGTELICGDMPDRFVLGRNNHDICDILSRAFDKTLPLEHWTIRFITKGDHYGAGDCLTYQENKPMVAFYDADYKNKGNFGPYGQFTGGSYYLETLQGKDGYSPSYDEYPRQLSLMADIPKWTVSAKDMNVIMDWLNAREAQLLKDRKPSLSEQMQSAKKRTEQQKDAPTPGQEKDR